MQGVSRGTCRRLGRGPAGGQVSTAAATLSALERCCRLSSKHAGPPAAADLRAPPALRTPAPPAPRAARALRPPPAAKAQHLSFIGARAPPASLPPSSTCSLQWCAGAEGGFAARAAVCCREVGCPRPRPQLSLPPAPAHRPGLIGSRASRRRAAMRPRRLAPAAVLLVAVAALLAVAPVAAGVLGRCLAFLPLLLLARALSRQHLHECCLSWGTLSAASSRWAASWCRPAGRRSRLSSCARRHTSTNPRRNRPAPQKSAASAPTAASAKTPSPAATNT